MYTRLCGTQLVSQSPVSYATVLCYDVVINGERKHYVLNARVYDPAVNGSYNNTSRGGGGGGGGGDIKCRAATSCCLKIEQTMRPARR